MDHILHITTQDEFAPARQQSEYFPERFEDDGFIHCCSVGQLLGVAERHFKRRADLVVLEIDLSKLGDVVVEENLEAGEELYPHIYGRLPMSAVSAVHDFPRNGSGSLDLPEALR